MNIVLWIGNESNQRALANKIHNKFPVAAIVTETRKTRHKITFSKMFEKVMERLFLSAISKAWVGLKKYYDKKYPSYPDVKKLDIENINNLDVLKFTQSFKPDIIIVSGTRLIKERMFEVKPNIGILNMHTGLSPYVKGGPNCTNWCISSKQLHLIGNTIMWLDAGIDTGNIITTEITEFEGSENLNEVHLKVMENAHALYLKAMEYLMSGRTSNVLQNSIAPGKTYYNKDWGIKEKMKLISNFKFFKSIINSKEYKEERKKIITISLSI